MRAIYSVVFGVILANNGWASDSEDFHDLPESIGGEQVLCAKSLPAMPEEPFPYISDLSMSLNYTTASVEEIQRHIARALRHDVREKTKGRYARVIAKKIERMLQARPPVATMIEKIALVFLYDQRYSVLYQYLNKSLCHKIRLRMMRIRQGMLAYGDYYRP